MRDKHTFSKSYTDRKEAVLRALRREDALEAEKKSRFFTHTPIKILASVAILSVLTVSVYAAVQWIDFRMEQNGDEVRIHASLNESAENTTSEEKPLRSWRAEDGEISVSLQIPDLPADMSEDLTANGKYGSEDSSRSMTINGIDLRRSDLDQIIGGATNTKQLDVGGKAMYVVEKGEADFYNRMAYIVFEEDELVLKLWVSYGITDEELSALASTMTLEYTTDALLAIPIQNELGGTTNMDIPDVYYAPYDPLYESDLVEIGQSVRDHNDWYTATIDAVEVHDTINVLNPNYILRKDFVERFTDISGNLVPYNRTEVIITEEEGKQATKQFGETVSAKKKLYVVTLTMEDVTMDEIPEADRERMLKACVNSFGLQAYTVENGEIKMHSSNAVVDRKPNAYADSSEIIYRECLGNNQWKVAYLIDEAYAKGNLVLEQYTGKIYVNIQ
ncbi:MAG: hypothetical protein IJA67_04335 [Oscillospiraceae bacterium]|nr:hypothetical protein [Oscillospiraceae bacterium]